MSKVTDGERREVEAKLRAKHRKRQSPTAWKPQDADLQARSCLRDIESCLPDGESTFTVLADLIRPSCDRDMLLALARGVERLGDNAGGDSVSIQVDRLGSIVRNIREACGAEADWRMKYVSLFSGVEAATLAWEPLGWEPMAFAEIEPFPCAVLASRYPDVPNLGDVSKADWEEFKRVHGVPDVVVGGSPCQSFSIAGKREGLEGASGLMWEYVRACDRLRPRWLVWENVPGALSSSHGEDFGCLLRSLDELGYHLAWRILDAQFFGVAQRRRRVFLVGNLGAGRAAEVLLEPEGLRRDTQSSREKRASLAARPGVGAASAGFAWHCGGNTGFSVGETSPTITASEPPAVCAGFKQGAGAGSGSIGYAVEQAPTLTASASGTQQAPAVICAAASDRPVASYAVRMREGCAGGGKGPLVQEDVSGTLATRNDQTIFCMSDTQAHAGVGEGVCNTITAHCSKDAPVAFVQNVRNEVRKFGGDGATVGALAANPGMKQTCYVSHAGTVRRLTPRECERLQGMPDDWTKVPYRGKPAEECPDGPRYKAIGNSMAVPVMRWIGERIALVEEGEADAAVGFDREL